MVVNRIGIKSVWHGSEVGRAIFSSVRSKGFPDIDMVPLVIWFPNADTDCVQ